MKETAKKIGISILRIFLITMILTSIRSCAKAWTYDEFVTFCVQNVDKETNTGLKNAINKFIGQANGVKNYAAQQGINLDDYNNFWISNEGGAFIKYEFHFLMGTPTYSVTTSKINFSSTNTCKQINRSEGGGANFYSLSNYNTPREFGRKPFGLFVTDPTNRFP